MTPKQMDKFTDAIDARLTEYFDGYVLLGFIAGAGEAIAIWDARKDQKTAMALNKMLESTELPETDEEDAH